MSYSHDDLLAIWNKAKPINDQNSSVYRQDDFGNAIKFDEYGNRDSDYGWEVDHITPISRGGTDALSNLRPLHWKANLSRV